MEMLNSHPVSFSAELSTKPAPNPRQAKRLRVQMDAGLRQRGAHGVAIDVLDLSTHGFRASTHLELQPGTEVWLKLPGLEGWHAKVAWTDGYLLGCQFVRPLHPAVLENIVRSSGTA